MSEDNTFKIVGFDFTLKPYDNADASDQWASDFNDASLILRTLLTKTVAGRVKETTLVEGQRTTQMMYGASNYYYAEQPSLVISISFDYNDPDFLVELANVIRQSGVQSDEKSIFRGLVYVCQYFDNIRMAISSPYAKYVSASVSMHSFEAKQHITSKPSIDIKFIMNNVSQIPTEQRGELEQLLEKFLVNI